MQNDYSQQMPSTSKEITHRRDIVVDNHQSNRDNRNGISTSNHNPKYEDHRKIDSQLPSDLQYNVTGAMDRCSISRARSNDHLLETNTAKGSPYARKDLPLKQKSKSFENLGNDVNEDEVRASKNWGGGEITSKQEINFFFCLRSTRLIPNPVVQLVD